MLIQWIFQNINFFEKCDTMLYQRNVYFQTPSHKLVILIRTFDDFWRTISFLNAMQYVSQLSLCLLVSFLSSCSPVLSLLFVIWLVLAGVSAKLRADTLDLRGFVFVSFFLLCLAAFIDWIFLNRIFASSVAPAQFFWARQFLVWCDWLSLLLAPLVGPCLFSRRWLRFSVSLFNFCVSPGLVA